MEKRLVDTVGEGQDEVTKKTSMEIYTLPCIKQDSQWEFAL